jgi:carotenoid cleavage dioxygenase-like enzyme
VITRRRYLEILMSAMATSAIGCNHHQNEPISKKITDSGVGGQNGDTGEVITDLDTGDVEPTDTGTPTEEIVDVGPELPNNVPRSVLQSGTTDQDLNLNVISGTYPEDILGHVFFIHPKPFEDGSAVLLGDGVLNRIDLEGSPSIKRRLLKTPCHFIDQATVGGNDEFFNNDLLRFSMTWGKRNFPNTGVLEMNGRIIINSDAGAPWEIDPFTLELISQVGWSSDWKGSIPEWTSFFVDWPFGLTFTSAHPVYDPVENMCIFPNWGMNFTGVMGPIGNGYINLLTWDGEGDLYRSRLIQYDWLNQKKDLNVDMSIHQMAVTSHHIIIMDTAFQSEVEDVMGLGDGSMKPQKDVTKLFIFEKQYLNSTETTMADITPLIVEIPREAAHFIAEYDSSDNILKLHVGHQCASDPSEFVKEGDICAVTGEPISNDLHGMLVATTDIGVLGRYEINTQTGAIVDQKIVYDERLYGGPALYTFNGNHHLEPGNSLWWLSFGLAEELRVQGIEDVYSNYAHRIIDLEDLPSSPPHITRVNSSTYDIEDSYAFPAGRFASSPTFVPSTEGSNAPDNGYIFCIVLSDDESTLNSSGDEIWIFDALDLEQGPICRLGHSNLNMPLTLHTCYIEELTQRNSQYLISIREDLEPRIASLNQANKDLFEQEVFSRFN